MGILYTLVIVVHVNVKFNLIKSWSRFYLSLIICTILTDKCVHWVHNGILLKTAEQSIATS